MSLTWPAPFRNDYRTTDCAPAAKVNFFVSWGKHMLGQFLIGSGVGWRSRGQRLGFLLILEHLVADLLQPWGGPGTFTLDPVTPGAT